MSEKVICVVDDDRTTLTMLEGLLAQAEYEVLLAENGVEAIKIIKESHPDLIIMDILLPDLQGGDVVDRLKKDPSVSSIPVIFLSAIAGDHDESREISLVKVGGQEYKCFKKPLKTEMFMLEVGRILFGEDLAY